MSIMWKKFTTLGAVASIYSGLTIAVVLLILSPTVWVDIVHKDDVKKVTAQIKEIDTASSSADAQIADLQKQIISADMLGKMKKKEKVTAEKKNAGLQASITAKTQEKDQLAAKKKDAASNMPKAIFPLKNPGIYSMFAAFLIGILVSLLAPEKEAEDRYADEKLREYVGIGAE
jgi:cation/acetate symporter